jgi:hypothetical protein
MVPVGIKLMLGVSCTSRHNEMDIMSRLRELAEDHVSQSQTRLPLSAHVCANDQVSSGVGQRGTV